LELSLYYNIIDNYIYQRNIAGEMIDVEGETYPVYRYVQGNSLLRGFEAGFDIHPWDHIHFDNTFAYTRGTNRTSGTDLPLIPAFRENHELRWNFHVDKHTRIKNPYIYIAFTYVWDQSHYDEFETETKAYGLWKAGMGADIRLGRQLMHLFVEGDNLLDTKYYDHLSRLKYAGILEMGRNITLGLRIPFDLKN
jgi:iron complex outermembrane receptor protein